VHVALLVEGLHVLLCLAEDHVNLEVVIIAIQTKPPLRK